MNGYAFIEGKGRHYGVPARDLTQDEFERMSPALQRIVRESPAYKGKGGAPPKSPKGSQGADAPTEGEGE